MARLSRVVAPAPPPHHVTQRGNRRQQTFFGGDDFRAIFDPSGNNRKYRLFFLPQPC